MVTQRLLVLAVLAFCACTNRNAAPSPITHTFRQGTGVVEIGVGQNFACARFASGNVQCWGNNILEQIAPRVFGDPTDPGRERVAPRVSLVGARELSVGACASCAALDHHQVRCWGSNVTGAIDSVEDEHGSRMMALRTQGWPSVHVVSGSDAYCMYGGSHAECWGSNSYGVTGHAPTLSPRGINGPMDRVPVPIAGISPTQIVIGSDHACALHTDGTVSCWGKGTQGQLGDGQTEHHAQPARVTGLANVTQLATASDTMCALNRSGAIYCWGRNSEGQLGAGSASMPESRSGSSVYRYSPTPVRVQNLPRAVQIAVGGTHACAVLASGEVRCWGDNRVGALGDRTTIARTTPVAVSGVRDAVQVSCSQSHDDQPFSCALLANGEVHCWGGNDSGQLGPNAAETEHGPVRVALTDSV